MKTIPLLFVLSLCFVYVASSCSVTKLPLGVSKSGYCSSIWASGLSKPRGILTLSNNDVLVVEATPGRVTVLWEVSAGNVQRATLVTVSGLNHGLARYASTATTVYRWPFTVGTRTALGSQQTVVTGMPSSGHATRTLIFGSNPNLLYVSVGSGPNIDTSTDRSGVYTFDLTQTLPLTYAQKGFFTRGNRNEVGLRFDASGKLWGVENGADSLNRADLGGDIHNDNPGEEINQLVGGGAHYGYPYCWSQYNLTTASTPRGTQWAWPDFISTNNDAWCRSASNNKVPGYLLPAHTAPLDIIFKGAQNFPGVNAGDAFVAEHGSWNRNPPIGYLVALVRFNAGVPTSDEFFLKYQGPGATGTGWHRPVGLGFGKVQGVDALLVTSDTTNVIIAITSNSACTCV